MFVGEIGIPRREFLYDLTFWEARRIARGYQRRNRLEQQLLRLTAYMSCFAMRENKGRKTPGQWLPLPWEKDDDEYEEYVISDEEQQEILELMSNANAQMQQNGGDGQ